MDASLNPHYQLKEPITKYWGGTFRLWTKRLLPIFDVEGLPAWVKLWFQDVEISGLSNSQQL